MQSTGTVKTYENILKKYSDLSDHEPYDVLQSLEEMKLSPAYIKVILCAIIWKLKKDGIKANSKTMTIYKYIIAHLKVQCEKRERDHSIKHGNIPLWENVIEKRDSLKDDNIRNHLILSLYTYVPPRRIKDFVLLKIVKNIDDTDDKKFNYYVVDDKTLIFNVYKTSRTYGQQIISVPDKLHKIIINYAGINKLKYGGLLLGMKNYFQMNYILNKLTGASVDNLRHSYVNYAYRTYKVPTNEFMEELARQMGHSVETNLRYRKF